MEECNCSGGSHALTGTNYNSGTGDYYWPYFTQPYCPYCQPRCPRCGRPLQDCSPWYPQPWYPSDPVWPNPYPWPNVIA